MPELSSYPVYSCIKSKAKECKLQLSQQVMKKMVVVITECFQDMLNTCLEIGRFFLNFFFF